MDRYFFGSRAGSSFALLLFGTIIVLLTWGIVREMRRRSRIRAATGLAVGSPCVFLALALVYASSFSGFYELQTDREELRLRYLLPVFGASVPLTSVSEVDAMPTFKSGWRLRVRLRSGSHYESARSNRADVIASAERLRALVNGSMPR